MKTILSVDSDFFARNIGDYHEYLTEISNNNELNKAMFEHIKKEFNINVDELDMKALKWFSDIIPVVKSKDTRIIFIDEHDEIYRYMGKDCDVINIDFHHDLKYNSRDNLATLDLGNWACYARKYGKLDKYLWVHKVDSVFPEHRFIEYNNVHYHDLDKSYLPKVDAIIICGSHGYCTDKIRKAVKSALIGGLSKWEEEVGEFSEE